MNLLTIYPIQACNLHCEHCPSKGWIYPADSKKNSLTNKMIFGWLDKYCPPSKWYIELTGGGEPSLYPEIEGLMYGLEERGYKGLVKTNGILPIPKVSGFKRIAAWHGVSGTGETLPKSYDEILVIRNPDEHWEEKIKYCVDNNIPYRTVQFVPFGLGDGAQTTKENETEEEECINEIIDYWCVMYSNGQLSKCYSATPSHFETVSRDCPPVLSEVGIGKPCQNCRNITGFVYFLDK